MTGASWEVIYFAFFFLVLAFVSSWAPGDSHHSCTNVRNLVARRREKEKKKKKTGEHRRRATNLPCSPHGTAKSKPIRRILRRKYDKPGWSIAPWCELLAFFLSSFFFTNAKYEHAISSTHLYLNKTQHHSFTEKIYSYRKKNCIWLLFQGTTPDHLLLDRSSNIGPPISRWELDKLKNCWNKSFRTSKILKLMYQQFLNLFISQRDISGPRLGALSNNRWSAVRIEHHIKSSTLTCSQDSTIWNMDE
jgi:hypothetical protein